MAVLNLTYNFASSAQGWATTINFGDTFNVLGFTSGSGNPAGCLQVNQSTNANNPGQILFSLSGAWTALGVPAGATVTGISMGIDEYISFDNTDSGTLTGPHKLTLGTPGYDSTAQATLQPLRGGSADIGWVSRAGVNQSVPTAAQPASTAIAIEVITELGGQDRNLGAIVSFDNIVINITYTPAVPPALVRKSPMNTSNSSTATATLPAASTAGNLLVAFFAWQSTGAVTTPTGWTLAVNNTGMATIPYIFYRANAPSTTSLSITMANAGNWLMGLAEYSGINTTSSIIDQTNKATTGGTTGSVTTTNASELLVGVLTNQSTSAISSGTNGFNFEAGGQVSGGTGQLAHPDSHRFRHGGSFSMSWFDQVVTSTGTYSCGAQSGTPDGGIIASFVGTGGVVVTVSVNLGAAASVMMCC